MGMEKCKVEPCIFRKMVNGKVSLMVGVHVDDIILSGEKDVCDVFFNDLKVCFPVKHQGGLKMYTGCAFKREWESRVLEIKQKAFVENLISQHGITAVSGIPARPWC